MNSTNSYGTRSDRELLTIFVNSSDRSALTELVRRYEGLVWSVCSRSLNNRCDSEDAFQTTFLLLTTKANRIRNRDALSHWLYGVARKTCSQMRRQRARQTIIGMDVEDQVGNEKTVLEILTKQYEIDLIDQQLERMSLRHRTPLVLFYFAGLSVKQIAHQLNLSVTAVEGRLRRGRANLKRKLVAAGLDTNRTTLAAILVPTLFVTPGLVAKTGADCLAAFASTKIGIANLTLSTGTKIMICKGLCIAGISSILAVCGLAHSGALQSSQNKVAEVEILDAPATNDGAVPSTVQISLQEVADDEMNEEDFGIGVFRVNNLFNTTHDVIEVRVKDTDELDDHLDHFHGVHDWLHSRFLELFSFEVEEEIYVLDAPN